MCEIVKNNKDFLVTRSSIDHHLEPNEIVKFLRDRRTTGELVFHFQQGGVRQIVVVEESKASSSQADQMREILGME